MAEVLVLLRVHQAGRVVLARVGVAVVVVHLAALAHEAHRADAAVVVDLVDAFAAVLAGRRVALVSVDGTILAYTRLKTHKGRKRHHHVF